MSREEQLKKLRGLVNELQHASVEVMTEFNLENEDDEGLCDEADELCEGLVLQHYDDIREVLRRCQKEGYNPFLGTIDPRLGLLRPKFLELREKDVEHYQAKIREVEQHLCPGDRDSDPLVGSWHKELAGRLAEAELWVEALEAGKQEEAARAL
jgi:hypothetical protein